MNYISAVKSHFPENSIYLNIFLHIKLFGWNWTIENLQLSEEFMEEFTEELNWFLVFNYQDFSPEFGDKFSCLIKKKNDYFEENDSINQIEKVINQWFYHYEIRSSLRENKSYYAEVVFSGPKGLKIFKKFKDDTIISTNELLTINVSLKYDTSIKKNSAKFRLKINEHLNEKIIFIV